MPLLVLPTWLTVTSDGMPMRLPMMKFGRYTVGLESSMPLALSPITLLLMFTPEYTPLSPVLARAAIAS